MSLEDLERRVRARKAGTVTDSQSAAPEHQPTETVPPTRRGDLIVPYKRHAKLTKDLIAQLAAVIYRGNYRYVAAQACGIAPATFYRWIRAGERAATKHQQGHGTGTITLEHLLFEAINRAEAESHERLLQDVLDADDPKLKFEFLKRRFKKLYNEGAREIDDSTGIESESLVDVLRDKLLPLLRPEQRAAVAPIVRRVDGAAQLREADDAALDAELEGLSAKARELMQ